MALPVLFNLIPPSVVVSQTAQIYGLALPTPPGALTFGYVEQVNYNTLSVYAGQRILYEQPINNPQFFINKKPYFIIDEAKIFLIEPPELTPP